MQQITENELPSVEQWKQLKSLALQVERDVFGGDVDSYLNSLGVQE